MGRILGNPYGEIRGKVGGSVFSRNRAGQFMRVYVKPAQANSIQQLNARGQFGANSQAYSAIGIAAKGAWATFATAIYNPLRKTNVGQYTAQQAFIGITTSVNASANAIFTGAFCTISTTTPIASTVFPWVTGANAPATSVIPAVNGNGGVGPQPLGLGIITSAGTNQIKFNLLFGATGAGISAGQLVDTGGKRFTIGVYLSNPLKFQGSRPKNKWQNFIGNFAVPTFTTPLAAGTLGVSCNITNFPVANWKRLPATGDIYLATVIAVGVDGTVATIGSQNFVMG